MTSFCSHKTLAFVGLACTFVSLSLSAQESLDTIDVSIRTIEDMLRLDVQNLFSDVQKSAAVCQLDSQGAALYGAGSINANTGQQIPPLPGEHNRFVCEGTFKILTDLKDQKLSGKTFNYEVDGHIMRDRSIYEEVQRFSPFYVKGTYLCIASWPAEKSLSELRYYPDVYLITPSYEAALLERIARKSQSFQSDVNPTVDIVLNALQNKNNDIIASSLLKIALSKSPLSDKNKIQEMLERGNTDSSEVMLLVQLLQQQDSDAVHNVEQVVENLLNTTQHNETFYYNVALAILVERDKLKTKNIHLSLVRTLNENVDRANASDRIKHILDFLNAK